MTFISHSVRSLSLLLVLSIAHHSATAHPSMAQSGCGGTISGDVAVVSVTTGGAQNLSLTVPPGMALTEWHVLGSLSGTSPGMPYLVNGGLFLNQDRYMNHMVIGQSKLLHGGTPAIYGVIPNFDSQGHASLQVVIPPVLYSALVGRTLHHGFYTIDANLLPACGTNTAALTLVP